MLEEPISVLVVDDEHLARERLGVLLGGEPDVECVGECGNGLEALDSITTLRPELVFLDVQMPDLDGLGVIAALTTEATPEIIFVTAHNAYMERAFEIHAVDYLRKPYTNARFASALAHARKRIHARRSERGNISGQPIATLGSRYRPVLTSLSDANPDPRIRLQDSRNGAWHIVRQDEIGWIEADGSPRILVHIGKDALPCRMTLADISRILDARMFVRMHRSFIVNTTHIQQVKALQKGEYAIYLGSNTVLDSGRTFR